ncbi:MAG: organoarsenical effux MFS transporter ArsJ [Porticoccaceae bacterium]|nr:organoarsenical effux MFS transporter ArsJ [Porticoccaceae bacterium]
MHSSSTVRQTITITLSYWAFTLTDGALRMLVLFFFHGLGYSPLEIASLFLLYEFFGMLTNLYGGWLATRIGLNSTLQIGLGLQILALAMLAVEPSMLSLVYVMIAQAVSGIAKDLNKMSAKSSIKLLIRDNQQTKLYKWVALLTGSKNSLKGLGFFLGGALMTVLGFRGSLVAMMALLVATLILSWRLLETQKTSYRPKFTETLSKSSSINLLSAARFFLFGSRDIWFVVALPLFLQSQLNWAHLEVGGFMASWLIVYGMVQTMAPRISTKNNKSPNGSTLMLWAIGLALIPASIALGLSMGLNPTYSLVIGLLIYGAIFAINSSAHSFLIVAYAQRDAVSTDIGFYYMANAAGRLTGTLLSGLIYQQQGLVSCLLASSAMVVLSAIIAAKLPRQQSQ